MDTHGRTRTSAWRLGLGSAGLTLLVACGGGGSDNIRIDPPAPPTPPPAEPEDPQPAMDAHLAYTNTYAAHDAGLTGAGVTIGFLDSGIRRDHPAIDDRVVASYTYLDPIRNNLDVDDVDGHGTAVAQIAGGGEFGQWPGGVAPGASFVSARIISDEPPEDDGSGQGNEVDDGSWLGMVHDDLMVSGAMISNNSWGGLYWNGDDVTRTFVDAMRPFVVDWGGLVVFATGNQSEDDPTDAAALPSLGAGADVLERGWLAVSAVKSHDINELADYANACGIASNYCLVAPGGVIFTGLDDTAGDPSYWIGRGTSFAAPQVSGAAALVWEAFPYFDNDMVRQTLLGTAQDLGEVGVDEVFGHGLLDVGRAVQGPGRLAWGDVTADFGSGTSVWSNDISGAGGITKRGAGHLDLTGENSYEGTTHVAGGDLSSRYDLPGDANVTGNGLLLLDNISVRGDLRNAGIVSLYGGGAEGAVHVVDGDYTQTVDGTLAFDVGSQLHVQGSASVDGEVLVTGVTDGYVHSTRETFLQADGGLSGTFDSLFAADGVFLEASLGYDADSAWLDIDRLDVSATAQSMGLSPAAVSAATRVEFAFGNIDRGAAGFNGGGASTGVDGFISGAATLQRTPSAAAAERSLSSLSGELHSGDAAFAMMAMEDGRHALESRLDQLDRGVASGAWADRIGGDRPVGAHASFDANGWMLGHDARLSPNLTVGAAFGQTDGAARHDLRRDREHNRQYEGQLYAAWSDRGNYLLGRLASGRMDRSLQRDILLGEARFGVDADYANHFTSVGLQAGHRFDIGAGTLTPYIGTQALRLERDGFTEHGAAGFGLSTGASTLEATQALAGARLERDWWVGAAKVSLQGRVEWQKTLSQSGQWIDARFTGIDAWAPITGAGLGEEATVFGLGLGTALPMGRLSLDVDARREFGRTWTGAHANWTVGF